VSEGPVRDLSEHLRLFQRFMGYHHSSLADRVTRRRRYDLLNTSVFQLVYNVLPVGNNLFLAFWTSESIPGFSQSDYMTVYSALGVAQAVTTFAVSFAFLYVTTLPFLSELADDTPQSAGSVSWFGDIQRGLPGSTSFTNFLL
jgi:hypothetical protein